MLDECIDHRLGVFALAGEPYARDVFFSQGIDLVSFRSCFVSAVPIIKNLFWSSSYVVFTVGIGIVAFSVCL